MNLFKKTSSTTGWMALNFQNSSFCVAHIQRSATALPVVTLAASYHDITPSDTAALTKFSKELHAHRYQCTTLLSAHEYTISSVETPNVPQDEIKTAVRWRLKDMLDYPVDEATLDVLDIPQEKNSPMKSQSMYAIAARSKSIEQCQNLFGQAKIPLRTIDIPEMAQRNIATLLQAEDRGVVLLSFNTEGGLLTITFAGGLYLSRRIDVTLSQLMQSDAEQKAICYDKITLELQRSLDHFDRQYNFITLSKLVLAPLGDAGAGLKEYMTANLYIPVEILNLETILDFSKVPELKKPQQQQHYFTVLGAALRDASAVSINLYNPLLLKQKNHFPAYTMVHSLGLITLGILLFYGYAWYSITEMEKQAINSEKIHDATQAQFIKINSESNSGTASKILENEVSLLESQLNARRQIINLMQRGELGNTEGFSEYLRALSRQAVDGLWITRFQASGAGEKMTISGRALHPAHVPAFIHQLKQEKIMVGKIFETLEMNTPVEKEEPDKKLSSLPPYIEFNLHNTQQEHAK